MSLALMAALTVTAQHDNMAIGCTAKASTEAGAHTAAMAVDGDATGDSRWESLYDGVADADAQWWSVDLGSPREFDMIQIVWEEAYAKAFRIVAANEADFSDARTVVERDETLTSLTCNYDLPSAVTARYVRFEGIERALPYGYSFYEFGVYKKSSPVLTSLTATPSADLCRVGSSIEITCAALDQYSEPMATGSVTYTVSPATAGTFCGDTYTPTATGASVITAHAGGVDAEAFEIVAYDGSNVASAEKVTDCNAEAGTADMTLAFDGDEGPGEWTLHGTTGDSEAERTYDAWFTLDLGKDYTVSMVSVCFEGASSSAYTIAFSSDGVTWADAAAVEHPSGINAWKDRVCSFTADASAVRHVRFKNTRAATQYGVKVREFAVYGRAVDGEITSSRQPDGQTGVWVIDGELNGLTAAYFADDYSTAYDLRTVSIAAPITLTAMNPNAIFIVTEAQKAMLTGTDNLVTLSGGAYHADRITLTDGHDVNTLMTITADVATYSRAATDSYQTLVVPFTASVPAGMRAYALVDLTSSGILFQGSTVIEAGRPYLLTGQSVLSLSATDAVLDFHTDTDSGDDASLSCTYSTINAPSGSYVLDSSNRFRRTADGATVPAFRAWLTLSDTSTAKVGITFGETTGVSGVTSTASDDAPAYSLSGIRIDDSKPWKGIYIKGGRKLKK